MRKITNLNNCEIDTKFVYDKDGNLIMEKTEVKKDGANLYTSTREYIWSRILTTGKSVPVAVKDKIINIDKNIGGCFGVIMKTEAVSELPISEETFQDDFSQPFQNNWTYAFISATGQPPQYYNLGITQGFGRLNVAISSEAGAPSETVAFILIPKWTFNLQDFSFSIEMNIDEVRNSSFGLGSSLSDLVYHRDNATLVCVWPIFGVLTNTLCYLREDWSGDLKQKSFPFSLSEVGKITYNMEFSGGILSGNIPELGFSESVTFYPMSQTFIYGVVEIKGGKFNQAESSIINIAFDNFRSSLRVMKSAFPYTEVEFLGERYNDYISELGGDTSERSNYWVIRNGGGISIYKDSGSGISLDLTDERINLGLIVNGEGKSGSVFTNLSGSDFESFCLSRGLRVVGF